MDRNDTTMSDGRKAPLITAPGLYPSIAPEEYFSEPCPAPALTNSLISILTNKSPAHARHAHPSLNPSYDPKKSSRAMSRGSLVHRLALDKGQEIIVSPYDEFRTKESKEWRDGQPSGCLIVKQAELETAEAMASVIRRQIEEACQGEPYETEVVFAWLEGDVWCRGMLDVWCPSLNLALDPKTCADASDHAVDRVFAKGYARQQSWYQRGLSAINGESPQFKFLFVEGDEPHVSRVASASEGLRSGSDMECDRALSLFGKCLASGEWPGYENRIVQPTSWQVREWEDALLENETGEE